jgi:hypothetical protein
MPQARREELERSRSIGQSTRPSRTPGVENMVWTARLSSSSCKIKGPQELQGGETKLERKRTDGARRSMAFRGELPGFLGCGAFSALRTAKAQIHFEFLVRTHRAAAWHLCS